MIGSDERAGVDADGIQRILPHRYPSRRPAVDPPHRAGIKQVTVNEPLPGTLPGLPSDAVLIVEAMAQVGGVAVLSADEYRDKPALSRGSTTFDSSARSDLAIRFALKSSCSRSAEALGWAWHGHGRWRACLPWRHHVRARRQAGRAAAG